MKTSMNRMAIVMAGLLLAACSQQPEKAKYDPLQNTKKLAAEGHASLYNNGAFEIPMTTIHIIPPGPGTLELASEMAGMRARQSFQESIKHARESVALAGAGVTKSESAAMAVHEATSDVAGTARGVSRYGMHIAGTAPGMTREIVAASVTYSKQAQDVVSSSGEKLAEESVDVGGKVSAGTSTVSGKIWDSSMAASARTASASKRLAGRQASSAIDRFVKGYAAVPDELSQHGHKMADSASFDNFVNAYQRSNEWRSKLSGKMTDVMVGATSNYESDVAGAFKAAGHEMSGGSGTGPTLAALKSLRWIMQGIFWDATIKPAGKLAGASLGYLTANTIAFPALITVNEGVAVAHVAVQVTWNSAAAVYDVTAPTATAALAGLFSAVELVGGETLAGTEAAAGTVATAGTYAGGKVAAGAIAGGGYATGKTMQYVGAPLSSVGIKAGGGAIGVVAGTATAATGAGLAVAGAGGEAVTQVAGVTTAGTVLVGGSTASVAAGTALGTYELSKAVVVPAGYELGSGLVLSYGTLSQLSSQTLLAVSDASYMVLSLEGSNWVLYAIKGKLDKGDDIPTGTLLDLKAMQRAGETIVAVPVSEKEMTQLVNAVPGQLPPVPQPATTQPAVRQ